MFSLLKGKDYISIVFLNIILFHRQPLEPGYTTYSFTISKFPPPASPVPGACPVYPSANSLPHWDSNPDPFPSNLCLPFFKKKATPWVTQVKSLGVTLTSSLSTSCIWCISKSSQWCLQNITWGWTPLPLAPSSSHIGLWPRIAQQPPAFELCPSVCLHTGGHILFKI